MRVDRQMRVSRNTVQHAPGFNRGIWRKLEEWVREQAVANEEVYVVTGHVLTDGPYPEIGPNGVDVPKMYRMPV